tara:strand:+ start:182 stop:421 length:240 start_codon:yes stop_codon:yes gene_type:complete
MTTEKEVTAASVMRKVNYHLREKHTQIRPGDYGDLGRFFLVSTVDGAVLSPDINLVDVARALGAMSPGEVLASTEPVEG